MIQKHDFFATRNLLKMIVSPKREHHFCEWGMPRDVKNRCPKIEKKSKILDAKQYPKKTVFGKISDHGRRRAQRPGGLGGTVIRLVVLNALHRLDAADLRRFAHTAVPVKFSLTFTFFIWKQPLYQGV